MDQLLPELLQAGIGLVSLALTTLIGMAFKWLLNKVKDEKIKGFFRTLEDVSYSVVSSLKQTMVDELKAKSADGKLSEDDIELLKTKALYEVMNGIPNTYIAAIKNQIPDLQAYAAQVIEKKVAYIGRGY
jgi:ribosome recycling factor